MLVAGSESGHALNCAEPQKGQSYARGLLAVGTTCRRKRIERDLRSSSCQAIHGVYTVPPGGIDNLALHSTDIFTIPGKGEFSVDFSGYFRVARDHPTTTDWTTFEIFVNITDLRLFGQHKDLGEIAASGRHLSAGVVWQSIVEPGQAAAGHAP